MQENTSNTQAREFATAYAADMAKGLLDTIKKIARQAGLVTAIGLGISMPHQISFILSLAPVAHDSFREILTSITLVLAAFGIPVMVDLLTLICIRVLATRGVDAKARKRALRTMWYPILISGAVNVLAPAPNIIRVLLGVMVTLIPAAEGLRSVIRPNFREIDAIESQVIAEVAQPVVAVKSDLAEKRAATKAMKAELTSRQLAHYRNLPPNKRQGYLQKCVSENLLPIPTSPAPAGARTRVNA